MGDNIWAFAANKNIQHILLTDNETGNSSKAPRLMSLDDYSHWKHRFETHINGIDTNLWLKIEEGYTRPLHEVTGYPIEVSRLNEAQRKDYDLEKKAYAILSQSIPKDIIHHFHQCTTSSMLWYALQARNEGNANLRKTQANALKKEFGSFNHVGNESLNDLIARFYHLLREMYQYGIVTTDEEKVQCLADALP